MKLNTDLCTGFFYGLLEGFQSLIVPSFLRQFRCRHNIKMSRTYDKNFPVNDFGASITALAIT